MIELESLIDPLVLSGGFFMKLQITKETGIPLYLQIKEQIKKLIHNGSLAPGTQLSTERDLALKLAVSRNTVSMAYEELKKENILVVGQGKGTFVSYPESGSALSSKATDNRKQKMTAIIDKAIDASLDLGFSPQQFAALVTVRVREREESFTKVRVLFIDCNQEQLHNFVTQFRELVHLDIISLLLHIFLTDQERSSGILDQVDLVITTTTHANEVTARINDLHHNVEVVAVSAQPRLESIISLTRIPVGQKVGFVCHSREFPEIVTRALAQNGIYNLQIDYEITTDPGKLKEFADAHDILFAFADRVKEVKRMAGEKEVIPYLHELDGGSVALVSRAVERRLAAKKGLILS